MLEYDHKSPLFFYIGRYVVILSSQVQSDAIKFRLPEPLALEASPSGRCCQNSEWARLSSGIDLPVAGDNLVCLSHIRVVVILIVASPNH